MRYLYEPDEPSTADLAPSAGALAQLPEALRQELADALINSNTEHITELILRVEQQDLALAKALETLETHNKDANP